jgi:hypothetical protein
MSDFEFESDVLKRRQEEKKLLILARVEEKEYISRCHAVNVCHGCGGDLLNNQDFFAFRTAVLICTDESCPEFTVQVNK